ncbi:hypothetical protein [Aquimarina sp. 2201CG14-23]|uniref:hypothetical protein n=1 Tax=Aquimarina mycalae TaxID=3040073 RepID=UPI002477FF0C|nr:hypothetical protein [Aquimarina sp. 2201CG14-23]MDH7446214.1 hypothetical protein [Aquimarina sp. 2201CG14-23]
MKKKLEAELISIAHKILQLKDTSTLPQLQEETRQLYEKLSVLNFVESHFADIEPTIGQIKSVLEGQQTQEFQEETAEVIKPKPIVNLDQKNEIEEVSETMFNLGNKVMDSQIEEVEEQKPEIIIEKINEKVTEDLFVPVPKFTEENVSLSEPVYEKNDKEEIGSAPQSMPILDKVNDQDEKPKSLNDQLKKGINIGLNDRLAFIKHLFDGSSTDYNRVLSQLNTLNSKSGATQFIKNMVKPDYNNWVGKDEYEERFMEIVTNKYEF